MNNKSSTSINNHWLAKRIPIFYGWVIIPISIISTAMTSPGQTYMISVFNSSFRDALGLNLSQLTGAYMFGTLAASIPQSYLGVLIDRYGSRRMLYFIVGLFALTCLFVSVVTNLTMLLIGFFLLRLLGQGGLTLISLNMLPMWFHKSLGTITGVKNVINSIIIGVIPICVLTLINQVGWQNTYVTAGVTVLIIMLPITHFLFINRPEDIGQLIDGMTLKSKKAVDGNFPLSGQHDFDLKEAMRTRSYWIFTLIWVAFAMFSTAITFNLLPIFTEIGLTEKQAAATFTIMMVATALFQVIGGFLADRVKLNRLAAISLILAAVGIGMLAIVPRNMVVVMYSLIFGLAQGLYTGVNNTCWVRYYGRENLGKIRGSMWTAGVMGSSVGPFLMGISFDLFGDFRFSIFTISIIFLIAAVASLWATPPNKEKTI